MRIERELLKGVLPIAVLRLLNRRTMYGYELITELTPREIDELVADGTISGGMLPKLAGAIDAAKSGVNAVHVVDGRVPHAMLREILTDQAYGTMIKSH